MFCPKGPTATGTTGNPASINLSGVDLENPTLFVTSSSTFTISFGGLTFTVRTSGDHYFRIPAGVTSISVNPSGSADIVAGEDIGGD